MADSFEPTKVARTTTYRWTENKTKELYYPTSGNCITIPYIECTSANEAAVNALLDEIKALAVTFDRKIWTASKEAGLFPRMVVRIAARTDVTAAEVGAAEPEWVTIAACDSTLGWDRLCDSFNLVVSDDYVVGDGSLQWDKTGGAGGGSHAITGVQHTALPGSPIDASGGDPGHVSVTFKVPTGTAFDDWTGAVLYVGTDLENCVKYEWDESTFVAGEWITLTAELDDVDETIGGGMDTAAISYVKFYLDTTIAAAISGILLDNVRIV